MNGLPGVTVTGWATPGSMGAAEVVRNAIAMVGQLQ
jgi:hypothetical protein